MRECVVLPGRGRHVTMCRVGAMAEWFMAAVLKTVVALVVTGGSNPSRSAAVDGGRCQSGRLEPPAKRLRVLKPSAGSNPVLPA